MLTEAYAEWLLWKLAIEQRLARDIFWDEMKKANSPDDYYEAKIKLRLNMDLGHWIAERIQRKDDLKINDE